MNSVYSTACKKHSRSGRPTSSKSSLFKATVLAALALLSSSVAAADPAAASTSNNNNSNNNAAKTTSFRIFQTLPSEPATMTPSELFQMHRTLRSTQAMIFAPSSNHHSTNDVIHSLPDDGIELALDIYTPSERRDYLVRRGEKCHPTTTQSKAKAGNNVNGGSSKGSSALNGLNDSNEDTSLQWYDVLSRYDSLMESSNAKKGESEKTSSNNTKGKKTNDNDNRNDKTSSTAEGAALEHMANELFKFCVLYNGDGHAFWGWEEQLLLPFRDVVNFHGNYGVEASTPATRGQQVGQLQLQQQQSYIHESFLSISPYTPATAELSSMIRLLLETPNDVLLHSPLLLPRELHRLIRVGKKNQDGKGNNNIDNDADDKEDEEDETIRNKGENNGAEWTLLHNNCIPLGGDDHFARIMTDGSSSSGMISSSTSAADTADVYARQMSARCPLSEGGYCCLTFLPGTNGSQNLGVNGGNSSKKDGKPLSRKMLPVMALRHPVGGFTASAGGGGGTNKEKEGDDQPMPFKLHHFADKDASISKSSSKPVKLGGVPVTDLPYISTVRLIQNNTQDAPSSSTTKFPTHPADTPNFFDILFENDCLPYRKECHRCLKDVANEAIQDDDEVEGVSDRVALSTNACSKCQLECPCYCDILCKVRPPPKQVVRTYSVHPPKYRKEPNRLVPKIIHQTWFEPVTKDKYPNMSRLIESWKKSGWEYYFYDDETAGDFLGTHFPSEVREAYESITPGAFKADLFRYCVLLVRGGVYADMDVLLQTNLDDAVANDIGFMTPIDEPGIEVGHRSCLWNGLIASAPAHPFLARTIEIVVNNIRNRFTSVDYDDMLCPNPILSVSHTVDTLFTCGPCILGAGINNLLGRHMQTEFEIGDVNIWQSENNDSVLPDDPRLLIPGRTVILEQNKNDMGAHRFTWADRNLIIAATDMPDYDDRPPSKEHYSKTHEKAGVYGMRKLYTDTKRANEEIRIVVEQL